jgi:CHAD domain-containing protein
VHRSSMLEQELKLSVTGAFAPEFPPGRSDVAGVEELPALDLRATYYDTHDLRLARNGVTLRCRSGAGDGPEWTVKLPVGERGASERDELHFEGGRRQVPEAAHDVVRALVRSEPLLPVARLRTRRRRWLLRAADGVEMAELVDDRVSVLERGRVVERFREVEIEGRNIDQDALERIAGLLSEDGLAPADQTPKLVRALGARAKAPSDVPAAAPPAPRDPAAEAVRGAIAAGVRRIVLNDPRTRLGEVEPLHQMRVGTRRLRSDLRTFRPLLDESWTDPLRADLKWLGDSLGAVRDLDVLLDRLRLQGADLPQLKPLLARLEGRRDRARSALLEDLRSPRYIDLLDRLVEATRRPALAQRAQEPSRKVLPQLAAGPWRKLAGAARALTDERPAEDFHRVRVLAKRARYAAEAVAPALGAQREDAERFAKRAAGVQEVLGELQDSVVAAETIGGFAREHAGNGSLNLAAGRMLEREDRAAAAARAEFPRKWRRLDRKKRRAWMQ